MIVKLKANEGRMAGDKPGRMVRGPPHRACGMVRNWEFIPQRKEDSESYKLGCDVI